LEVSSVARGLVTKVCKEFLLPKRHIKDGQDRQIEAIAATCGLIHDLGNPPFGHSGEDAIQEWFKKNFKDEDLRKLLDNREELVNDFLLFEGNAQTLRIVAKLQVLADFEGLNLTFGTLSALCKYTASSVEAGKSDDHAKSKTGYFTSEKDRVQKVRDKTGTGDSRNPITFLVEAADDIVYSVADIEDGVKKRILSWGQLCHLLQHAPEAGAAAQTVETVLAIKKSILAPSPNPDDLPDDVHCAAFRTAVIAVLVKAAAARPPSSPLAPARPPESGTLLPLVLVVRRCHSHGADRESINAGRELRKSIVLGGQPEGHATDSAEETLSQKAKSIAAAVTTRLRELIDKL
jgi:dGTPase